MESLVCWGRKESVMCVCEGEGGEVGVLGEGGCMREKWRKCVGEGYKGIGGECDVCGE